MCYLIRILSGFHCTKKDFFFRGGQRYKYFDNYETSLYHPGLNIPAKILVKIVQVGILGTLNVCA